MNDSETGRLVDEIARGFDGDAWHGSSLVPLLAGVSFAEAAAHPIPGAHSIWEIVLHATGWVREVTRRLGGGEPSLPAGGDWPEVPDPPWAQAWEDALAGLVEAHRELMERVAAFTSERLDEPVGGDRDLPLGSGVSFRVMLHGLVQHDAYHGGQIALLRKAKQTSR